MPTIEINGQKIEAENGKSIIEVADEYGVYIPRFCYHKKLSVAANCRMCLVEVEGGRKPAPACATPIADGMKVFTNSSAALHSQKAVMEFLLINHPLDCPICDQGGQCELQDLAMGFGHSESDYNQKKHSVDDVDMGPLIATEMTRCIHCTRCVRFTEEVAGFQELGGTDRGGEMQIGTYISRNLQSELSGNIVEVCPVGALLAKPSLYQARAWELHEYPSIAAHDCLGSNIFMHTRRGELLRVVPRENEALNEVWISDRDRFSYQGVNSQDRAQKPMIKINGQWQETDWPTALNFAVEGLAKAIHDKGADAVGALASPSSTVEECYLLQKFMRAHGVHNLDHRLYQTDFADQALLPTYLGLDVPLAEVENQNAILLLGSNIRHEQPLAALRVRKAAKKGAKVMAVNMVDADYKLELQQKIMTSPAQLTEVLQQIIKALLKGKQVADHIVKMAQAVEATDAAIAIAEQLKQAEKALILVGALALNHPQASYIRSLIAAIAELAHVKLGFLTAGANSAGAHIAGLLPHRAVAASTPVDKKYKPIKQAGLNVQQMIAKPLAAYVLLGIEPEFDIANGAQAMRAMRKADFVVSLSAYDTDAIRDYANVILPITSHAETSGTFVNAEGQWQSFQGAIPPKAEARPAWKVLRVLGNASKLDGFAYQTSEQVRDEVREQFNKYANDEFTWCHLINAASSEKVETLGLQRITVVPMYSVDPVVRRASALQKVFGNYHDFAYVHPVTAAKLQWQPGQRVAFKQDIHRATLSICISEKIPEQCVLIYAGTEASKGLGETFGELEVK